MLGMLPLSEVQGPRDDLEQKLAGADGRSWLTALTKFLRKENPWEEIAVPVTTAQVPAVARFVVKDYFKQDTSLKASVKISYVGDNFKAQFSGKTEEGVPAVELKVYRLRKASSDAPIIAALGDRHETRLAHFWTLLSCQPNGEQGVLLVSGHANIFYVDILWAVHAVWDDGGWNVDAYSVDDLLRWDAGHRVFSC